MRLAALGRTHWLYDSILAAVDAGHEVVLIGTCPEALEYKTNAECFRNIASNIGADFFCDTNINKTQYIQMIESSGADVAISANWIGIIGDKVRAQFAHGIINAHAGDLPRYRGNACPNWAILNGETEVVLTMHEMSQALDAGPILLQKHFPLSSSTYIFDIYRFMEQAIPSMFVDVLDGISRGTLHPRPQPADEALSLRCFPRLPTDGKIDWTNAAENICRLIRASAEPFAGAYTFVGGTKIILWRARAERLQYPYLGVPGHVAIRCVDRGELYVITGDGVLVVEEVETESGRMKAAEAISSTRTRMTQNPCSINTALTERIRNLEKEIASLRETLPISPLTKSNSCRNVSH